MCYVFVQGKTVNSFSKSNLKSAGFTGVEVFNEKMEDVFKGTTAKESFLYISITDPISMCMSKTVSIRKMLRFVYTLQRVHQETTHC